MLTEKNAIFNVNAVSGFCLKTLCIKLTKKNQKCLLCYNGLWDMLVVPNIL